MSIESKRGRSIRAWLRLEVTFDVPDDWTDERLATRSDERTEMLETLAGNAILSGDILASELDDWEVEEYLVQHNGA